MENRLDPTPHFERFDSYEQACRDFRWQIPQRFNIATEVCRRHADAVTRIALSDVKEGGINTYTFGGLDLLSDKFATALSESGINQGDSVAVMLPPSAALAIAQLAALKLGAVVVPLSMVSDTGLLQHALADSTAKALVIDESSYGTFEASAIPPSLVSRFVVRDLRPTATRSGERDFWSEVARASSDFEAVEAEADSAAFIFYVASQGEINGVVHSHCSVIVQLAGFEMFNDVQSGTDAVFLPEDDWSSPGAVLGLLYPAWWYGCSVVAGACEAGAAIQSMSFNEGCGRPETGWISGKCERWFATPSGSVGRPVPGRSIEIIDQNGKVLQHHEMGNIAVNRSDPGLFTGYQNNPARTLAAFIANWYVFGDSGYKDEDDHLFLSPRDGMR